MSRGGKGATASETMTPDAARQLVGEAIDAAADIFGAPTEAQCLHYVGKAVAVLGTADAAAVWDMVDVSATVRTRVAAYRSLVGVEPGTDEADVEEWAATHGLDPAANATSAAFSDPEARRQIERERGRVLAAAALHGPRPALADRVVGVLDFLTAEQPPELVEGLLPASGLGMLVGASGARKTFALVDLACAVATGTPLFGELEVSERRRVLLAEAESPQSLQPRILAWCQHRGVDPAELADWLTILPEPLNLMSTADAAETAAFVRDGDYGVLIVDTLAASVQDYEENSASDSAQVIRNLSTISGGDALVIVADHTGKAGGTDPRGSSAKYAGVDVVLALEPKGDSSKLTLTKSRSGATGGTKWLAARTIELHDGRTSLALDLLDASISPVMERDENGLRPIERDALNALPRFNEPPVSTGEAEALLRGASAELESAAARTLRRYLDKLAEAGMVERTKDGKDLSWRRANLAPLTTFDMTTDEEG